MIKRLILLFPLAIVLQGCFNNPANIAKTNKNDIIIHQLRVELEELKHHLHTNCVQINILKNKIVNSEDTILDLTQKEFVTHKQALEKSLETLCMIEDRISALNEADEINGKSIENLEAKLSSQERSVMQNKKKIREMTKLGKTIQKPL